MRDGRGNVKAGNRGRGTGGKEEWRVRREEGEEEKEGKEKAEERTWSFLERGRNAEQRYRILERTEEVGCNGILRNKSGQERMGKN